ncbi:MAG: AAA family ATPase, partial [Clostridia bacterium]|nr:AAA family ATPase [Clostridia bacterium]
MAKSKEGKGVFKISDFVEVISKYYYVDKSLLIKELLDNEGGDDAFLFTRPRRFGKSLNLSMIRTFFEKTESDTSVYFRNLEIWKCGEKYTSEQGKYPVIYFDLKDINDTTWEDMYEDFKDAIISEYERHSELEGSIGKKKQERYDRIVSGTGTILDYKSSLKFLTDILYEFHGVKPIILIDEYDTPVQKGYDFGFYDKVIEFVRSFLSRALKGSNLNNAFAVITGAMQVAKEGIYTGLNNLGVYSVMSERYSQYFGFTEDEVKKILDDFGHPEKFDDVCEWYDGYLFGNTKIFNPWSVCRYIDENFKTSAQWVDTSGNSIIRDLLKSPSDVDVKRLRDLMNDVPLYVKIKEKISYGDLYIESEEGSKSSIYSVMLASGYLTVRYDDDGFRCLVIPNTEIKE